MRYSFLVTKISPILRSFVEFTPLLYNDMKKHLPLLTMVVTTVAIGLYFLNGHQPEMNPYDKELAKYQNHKTLSYEEIKKLPKQDRPDLALLQEYEMTMDPSLGYPPALRKLEAFEVAKSRLSKSGQAKAIDGVEWTERGPDNVGGRTRGLMFDPNDVEVKKVWAGGISGGLWYNNDITDPASTWTNVDDFMSNLSIATLAFDPQNTNVFYMGTGERVTFDFRGAGIWKSADGGDTWDQLTNTETFLYTPKLVVTSSSTVIAATDTGIKRSTDGGTTWESPATATMDMADVEIAANGDLYAGDFTGRVHKSTDDGLTWSPMSPSTGGQRVEVATAASNSDVIYAISATGGSVTWFSKTEDAGATWSDIVIPNYFDQNCTQSTTQDFTRGQAWYDLIVRVHPESADTVIIGGIDLFKSVDGGASWGLISYWTGGCDTFVHADQHAIEFRPDFPNEAIFGNDGGVFYSSDVGSATDPDFIAMNNNYNVTQYYACAMTNEVNSNVYLAGAQDNGTQLHTEAGLGSTVEATGGDGAFCFIDQNNSNIMISSFVFNSYRLSTNGGVSFSSLSEDQGRGRFINPTDYDNDAKVLYGAGGTDEYTRIRNIDTTPTALEPISVDMSGRQITTITASPYTDNRIFVGVRISGGEGLLFRIDDAHDSPTVTEITGTFDATRGGWVSSIEIGESEDHMIATFSNYGVNSVFETTDGGTNWSNREGDLPDIPVYWALFNPNNQSEVLIATEVGVWSTDDFSVASPEWEPSNTGLANVSSRMLQYRDSDGQVAVATHGRGLFTSNIFCNIDICRFYS